MEEATRTKRKCVWGKFRELAPILTKRDVSLKIKGKISKICVQRVLGYASETWALKIEDEQRLVLCENAMVRWMCGVSLKNSVPWLS